MKLPEHVTLSFLLAQGGVQQQYGWAGTALMVLAGILPDLDGVGVVAGWRFYQAYHRKLGHGLPVTLAGPGLLALFGSWVLGLGDLLPLWGWLQAALLAHLFTDICFYRWPVKLLWPFTRHGVGCGWIGWNDLVPTCILYLAAGGALWRSDWAWPMAVAGIITLGAYLLWRGLQPQPRNGVAGWLMGGWAEGAAPYWRWLTGDFISS